MIDVRNVRKTYELREKSVLALDHVTFHVESGSFVSIVGPSGCGKSTLLLAVAGIIPIDDGAISIEGAAVSVKSTAERLLGMVFQRPNPFPLSIYENIIFGPRLHGNIEKHELDKIAEESLRSVLLWEEVKDKLNKSALGLSLEQRQRLCIARLIAVKSDILLMDEPCSTLDPLSTARIEELMHELKNNYSIIIVTHNMQQAARISDETGFMLLGELIEFGRTEDIFTRPGDKRTEDYITGRYG